MELETIEASVAIAGRGEVVKAFKYLNMFRTPVRNVFGDPMRDGDLEAPISTDRFSPESSPELSEVPKYFLCSQKKESLPVSCSKEDISMVAELEIVRSDLEIERQHSEELERQLKDKQKNLESTSAILSTKKGEISELKKKILELSNEGKAEKLKLSAELEAVKADKKELEQKLLTLEHKQQDAIDAAVNDVETKSRRRLSHMEEMLRARHLKYKAKEKAFLLEQKQAKAQLAVFYETLNQLGRQVPQIALAMEFYEKKRDCFAQ
mmetsp:Transcript_21852/g.39839  ORF Transcript_21852/g.39839 Transcript_21852/m.39839 type:complete len:266 (-) Transcript_21852:200-997(-)